MEKLSQRDSRWSGDNLGFSTFSVGGYGCFVTSLSMLAGIDPDKANDILKDGDAFQGALIISDKASEALGLDYSGVKSATYAVDHICIAEVDMSPAPGKQQHFVVYDPNKKTIIDPWTGREEAKDKYPFVSLRLFKPKTMSEKEYHITSDLENELKKRDEDFDGDKKSDQKDMAETLRNERHALEDFEDEKVVAEFGDYIIIKKK